MAGQGAAWLGAARQGKDRFGMIVDNRRIQFAELGKSRLRGAEHVKARQGKDLFGMIDDHRCIEWS